MMVRRDTEIDRLIEEGLGRYGEGDLEGALRLWERALVLDPSNAPAGSYVDYVRTNYELLTAPGNTEHSGPFGISEDEPDYQIEVSPAEPVDPAPAPASYKDARGEGWAIADERARPLQPPGALTFELEADEPPAARAPATFEGPGTGEQVSFDDATREYPGGAGRPAIALLIDGRSPEAGEFVPEVTPPFGSSGDYSTPQGFGSQVTDVRRRDLGFVQPTGADRRAKSPPPSDLKITVRTPQGGAAPAPETDLHRAPTADGERDDAGGVDDSGLALDLVSPPELDLSPAYASLDLELPAVADPAAALELVGRAETRPATGGAGEGGAAGPRAATSSTRPLPPTTRAPASAPASGGPDPDDDEPQTRERPIAAGQAALATAQTQELPAGLSLDPLLVSPGDSQPLLALTREFAKPTTKLAGRAPAVPIDPMISAPTRELGLRAEARPATEDEPTGEVDVQTVRSTVRRNGKPEVPGIDPIDARSAEILESVDHGAPTSETREDRTRRRITALLDRAAEWSGSDLERAVAAVDLALSEDPNSALAQKLIHRNREAIMNAFQGFLGDLQRAPALARPLHELGSAPISPRAAFLLSRVDGTLSLDEILDVSGMPRLEAYRYLCQLFLRGILR